MCGRVWGFKNAKGDAEAGIGCHGCGRHRRLGALVGCSFEMQQGDHILFVEGPCPLLVLHGCLKALGAHGHESTGWDGYPLLVLHAAVVIAQLPLEPVEELDEFAALCARLSGERGSRK